MTTEIQMIDRDDFLASQKAEKEIRTLDEQIRELEDSVANAKESLRISETALAAICESLAGKAVETKAGNNIISDSGPRIHVVPDMLHRDPKLASK